MTCRRLWFFKLFTVWLLCIVETSSAEDGQLTLFIVISYPDSLLPDGSSLTIRGDGLGLNWNQGEELVASSPSLWTTKLSYSVSDVGSTLQFKILVNDKQWSIGGNELVVLPSTSSEVAVYPWFLCNQGSIQLHHSIWSPQLNNSRDIIIYTPPSYDENYFKPIKNVLIMHDGQNLFNASTSFLGIAWNCQDTVNQLVNQGQMDEIMIVGVYNTVNRTDEYTYSYDPTEKAGGHGDLYLDFLVQTVLPFVKVRYHVDAQRSNIGILGSSLGGLISCYAGWTRSSVFTKAGCMSSSFWWNSEDFNNTVLVKNTPPSSLDVYLDSGDAGPSNDDEKETITVRNHIESLGWVNGTDLFYYLDHGGEHNEYYWGHRFHVPMTELYPFTPLPTTPYSP